MKYYCNPININYRYQFNADQRNSRLAICREAADPSLILFKGRYYLFPSMNLSVWVSDNLVDWESHRLPDSLPLYDYAPDARVVGEYVYFCASKKGEICNFYRTKDILNGPYEEIAGSFDFWDPNLFVDDDGRVYFYWGCSNDTPIWGVELDKDSMLPIGDKKELIFGQPEIRGFERVGENNSRLPKSEEEIEEAFKEFLRRGNTRIEDIPPMYIPMIKGMFSDRPYIEGAWMNKFNGKYYLQYAFAGTQYNTYGDGVYVGESPLGPFKPANNNPYSYKPGGFLPGAGHGSTMEDKQGRLWHTATMRISVNHDFERRVGIFPAGIDADGELFCNQRYADWPVNIDIRNPWEYPEWYLLSYNKKVTASSNEEGYGPGNVANEDVRSWWKAKPDDDEAWILMDLGEAFDVRGIQVNFADDNLDIPVPGEIRGTTQARYIDEKIYHTRWLLEGSVDGEEYFVIEDKRNTDTDLSHDFITRTDGVIVRYLRLSGIILPYNQTLTVSGLRVFGIGKGKKPIIPQFTAIRDNELDMTVEISEPDTVTGYNILWGTTPDKLYHSFMTFENTQRVGALVSGADYYVRVDAFNENGITEGEVKKLLKR
ncbi:MAG: family 43 glycosylhydrolase [Lachnospiraceae bacterium]|nr:family 43 glycosylhydrolase [Lachnospiraceae bacterium]